MRENFCAKKIPYDCTLQRVYSSTAWFVILTIHLEFRNYIIIINMWRSEWVRATVNHHSAWPYGKKWGRGGIEGEKGGA